MGVPGGGGGGPCATRLELMLIKAMRTNRETTFIFRGHKGLIQLYVDTAILS